MAKIYETKEDLQRERLHHIIDQQEGGNKIGISDTLFGVAATGLAYVYPYKKLATEGAGTVLKRSIGNKIAIGAGVAWTLLFGVGAFLLSHSQRNKAQDQLDSLGEEKIVVPTDSNGMQPYLQALTHQPSTDIMVGQGKDVKIERLQESPTQQQSL